MALEQPLHQGRDFPRVTDDDQTIAAALEDVSVPALVASVVTFTGDPSYLRGPTRPRTFIPNEFQGGLDESERAELRSRTLEAILAYRDAGCPKPAPLPSEVLRETMSWLACEEVDEEYVPMFIEEMNIDGSDSRRFQLEHLDEVTRQSLSVLVIGCGQSGLLAGIRLAQSRIPFTILDKNPDVGGTWYENTYPGCRVDVGNHFYCYSFEPNYGFSEFFSRQPELYQYFRDVMVRWGIADKVEWNTEVVSLTWDEDRALWGVVSRTPDGGMFHREADIVICAVGQLNLPYIPDLDGLSRFDGPVFHTAHWDHDVELEDKRVALIGAGASGFQVGPAIASEVDQLVVFQRTAQWMAPNAKYRQAVGDGVKWAMRHLPGYASWYRFMLLFQTSDKALAVVRIDPNWPGLPESANAISEERRKILVGWIEKHVGDDPELLAKVMPDYPPMGKRLLQDDGSWLQCLARDNVELVRDEIDRIDRNAVVTARARYEVDAIILATGFRANEMLAPIKIVGRGGARLAEQWGVAPAAHLGITVPGFPNLFLLYGPGTNLAHAGSIIFHSECQMQFIGAALRKLLTGRHRSIEVTQKAYDDYVERLQAELAETVWAHPSVRHSWYKGPDGRVHVLSPWRLVDYWRMTKFPDFNDYSFDAGSSTLR
jgi:4-hydroxyacetophenone monooxygenase